MQRGEIPRSEWREFFKRFFERHHGRLCSLAIQNGERSFTMNPLLLAAVGLDGNVEDSDIRVMLADWFGDHVARVIHAPRHVLVREAPEAASETLEIDNEATRTLMTFHAAN